MKAKMEKDLKAKVAQELDAAKQLELDAALARRVCPLYKPGDNPSFSFLHIPKTAGKWPQGDERHAQHTHKLTGCQVESINGLHAWHGS